MGGGHLTNSCHTPWLRRFICHVLRGAVATDVLACFPSVGCRRCDLPRRSHAVGHAGSAGGPRAVALGAPPPEPAALAASGRLAPPPIRRESRGVAQGWQHGLTPEQGGRQMRKGASRIAKAALWRIRFVSSRAAVVPPDAQPSHHNYYSSTVQYRHCKTDCDDITTLRERLLYLTHYGHS